MLHLPAPRPVSPRKQHYNEFVEDVGIGDIEVVLQRRHIDVAIELATL